MNLLQWQRQNRSNLISEYYQIIDILGVLRKLYTKCKCEMKTQ